MAKGQTRFTGFDGKIISMYARGMSTREIQGPGRDLWDRGFANPDLQRHRCGGRRSEGLAAQAAGGVVSDECILDAMMVKMRDTGHVREPGDLCGAGGGPRGGKGKSWDCRCAPAGGSRVLAASADRAKASRGEGYLHRLRGWAERICGSDRNYLSSRPKWGSASCIWFGLR